MADKLQNLSSGGNITKWSLQKDNVIKQSNTQNICDTKDMMDWRVKAQYLSNSFHT